MRNKIIFAVIILLCVEATYAGAKCRTKDGRLIVTDDQCPVGTMVEGYIDTGARPAPARRQQEEEAMPKVSVNYNNGDTRAMLRLLGEEMAPGKLFLDDTVSGTTTIREVDAPVDKVFFKILQINNLKIVKVRNSYYVYPASMGQDVAVNMAARKGL